MTITLLRPGEITQRQPRKFLVGGLLETTAVAFFLGEPGSGKSLIVCELTRCIATGSNFLGRRVLAGSVLYVAAERSDEIDRRLDLALMGSEAADNVRICRDVHDLFSEPVSTAKAIIRSIEAATFALPLRLIVIDTLAQVLAGADENSGLDAAKFWRGINYLRQATGAAIVLVHHVKRGEDRARGSQVFTANADLTLLVRGPSRKGPGTLTVKKANAVAADQALQFGVDVLALGTDPDTGEASTVALAVSTDASASTSKSQRLAPDAATALRVLADIQTRGPVLHDEWRAATLKAFGIRDPAALRVAFSASRKKLLSASLIIINGDYVSVSDPLAHRKLSEDAYAPEAQAHSVSASPLFREGSLRAYAQGQAKAGAA